MEDMPENSYSVRVFFYIRCLTLYHIIPIVNNRKAEVFKNMVGKGDNADSQYFLLSPHNVFNTSREKF